MCRRITPSPSSSMISSTTMRKCLIFLHSTLGAIIFMFSKIDDKKSKEERRGGRIQRTDGLESCETTSVHTSFRKVCSGNHMKEHQIISS